LSNILLINVPCYVFSGMAPKRRRFEPTPAADHPSHSAPAPTDEPTPAMIHHVPPQPEARLSINDPANKSRKISQKYWTVDVRGT
jgi:hypothetical protein